MRCEAPICRNSLRSVRPTTAFGNWYQQEDYGNASDLTYVLTYTPDAGFVGEDSFTYTIIDSHGATDTATVTVDVNPLPPIVREMAISELTVEERTSLLTDAAISILGPAVGQAFILRHGHAAVQELVKITTWGWSIQIAGDTSPVAGDLIDTGSQSIRVPAYYTYAGPNGGEPNFYSTDELADRVNELIYHEEVTQFNTGFDNGTQTPLAAFTEEFLGHPNTRIVINGAVVALAVYTGGASLSFTGVTGITSVGLLDATVVVGATWAGVRATDQIATATGEAWGIHERGDASYGSQLITRFTNDPQLAEDLITATDISITIVELGAGAYLFFKGTRIPSSTPAVKPAFKIKGFVDGIANDAIPGSLTTAQRDAILDEVSTQVGNRVNVLYEQPKNSFNVDKGEVWFTYGQNDPIPRGVFFEELQHLIDDVNELTPSNIPDPNTLENALFHRDVFERMASNPLFDITECEADDLLAWITTDILNRRGSQ